MKNLSKEYFNKFSEKPVEIKPFDPATKEIAKEYTEELKRLLGEFDIEYLHKGSTALGIEGVGEIEIGIYPKQKDWEKVIDKLKNYFGKTGNLEENYARFNEYYKDYKLEIILLKGKDAEVDKKLHFFLKDNPKLLKEYVKIKKKYSYSRREYQIQKNKFFRKVIKLI